jgi:uncharacterized protein YqfA (UPF0365 family)
MYGLTSKILAAGDPLNAIMVAVMIILGLVAIVALLVFLKFFRLWLQAKLSRADVKFAELLGMCLRRSDYRTIVICKITAIQGGLKLSTRDLESFYLAGGQITNVVRAMILAKKKNIDLSWEEATTADLDGRDVFKEVQGQGNANEGLETEARQ